MDVSDENPLSSSKGIIHPLPDWLVIRNTDGKKYFSFTETIDKVEVKGEKVISTILM